MITPSPKAVALHAQGAVRRPDARHPEHAATTGATCGQHGWVDVANGERVTGSPALPCTCAGPRGASVPSYDPSACLDARARQERVRAVGASIARGLPVQFRSLVSGAGKLQAARHQGRSLGAVATINASKLAYARARASGASHTQGVATAQAVADAWQLKGGQCSTRGNRGAGRLQPSTGHLPKALRSLVGGGPLDGAEAAGRVSLRRKADAALRTAHAADHATAQADRLTRLRAQLQAIARKSEKSRRQAKKLEPAKRAILHKIAVLLSN